MKIIHWINEIRNSDEQLVYCVALLNIAIDYCNIDKRCTNHYVYRENTKSDDLIIEHLRKEIRKVLLSCETLAKEKHYVIPDVKIGNASDLNIAENTFGVIFSHPPYGNSINYYSISRVTLSIFELINLGKSIISENYKYNLLNLVQKSDFSSGTLNKFNDSTKHWIAESSRLLKKNGVLLVIIGDSRDNGKLYHPHTSIIQEAEKNGMILRELFIWITSHKSGMHVRRKGHHIDHNYVLIFRKEK